MSDPTLNEFIELACAINCGMADPNFTTSLASAIRILKQNPELVESNLAAAAISGNHAAVKTLIERDPSIVNQPIPPRDWPPLLYLCFSRFARDRQNRQQIENVVATARLLLENGADPNAFFMLGDEKETCLYGACGVVNCSELAKLLLEHGADVNDEDASYHVSEFDNCECIGVLFDHGLETPKKATVLLRKLDFDDLDGVRYILERGVDPNEPGIWGKTAVHQAIMRGRSLEFFELLKEFGADLAAQRHDGATALYLAAVQGRQEVVDWLEAQGVRETWNEKQSLLAAIGLGRSETVHQLLESNPQISEKLDESDQQLLVMAGRTGNITALRIMVDLGFDIATQDSQGFSALHWAAWYGHHAAVEFLINRSAPLELKNNYGGTVIDSTVWGYANSDGCVGNCEPILKQLADAGADLSKISPFPSGNARVDSVLRSLGL